MLIDVHTHLDLFNETKLKQILNNTTNFYAIINNGLNHNTNKKTLELAKKYKVIKPALGIYPSEAIKLEEEEIKKEINFIKKNKPIAIGECGLDFTYQNKNKQIKVFKQLLSLAEKLKIPAIIHSRKAEKEVIEFLNSYKIKPILHCFQGNTTLIKKAEEFNCIFSIPCILTRSKHFQHLTKIISLTKILTETDAPFLSPFKQKTNQPSYITHTIKKIAQIKNITTQETEKIIFMNYKNIFF